MDIERKELCLVIARQIAKKRTDLGLKQSELAALVGVSRSAVSSWERGKCPPSTKLIPLLANALRTSIDELFGTEKTE